MRFVRVGLQAQTAALDQLDPPPHNAIYDSGDLRIVRREQTVKAYVPICVLDVGAVEDDYVGFPTMSRAPDWSRSGAWKHALV